MKLYELRADYSVCCSFEFREGEDYSLWDDGFDGVPRATPYPIPKGQRTEELITGPLPDFTRFALLPIPTFSERAISALGDTLASHGEFALIDINEPMRYFGFNPTTIVDGLDEKLSEIARFRTGRIMAVDHHELRKDISELPPIFKMPQTARNTTYVNEAFATQVQRHALRGFRFDLLFERQE